MAVNDSADKKLDCRFCYKQRMCREYAAHSAVGHASEQAQAGAALAPGVQILDGFRTGNDSHDKDRLRGHPNDELSPTKKHEKLVKIVCRFSNGSEDGNEYSAAANQDGPS